MAAAPTMPAVTVPAAIAGPVDVSDLTLGTQIAKNFEGLLPQPTNPKFKAVLVQVFVPVHKHPMGGSDKITNGNRFDTIPMANGLIKQDISCQILFYVQDEHDKFFKVLSDFDAIVVRQNPGQITAAGWDQSRFDKDMQKLVDKMPVWPTPSVMEKMGAKDALCNIKEMDFGLPDTLGYYNPDDMKVGFKKTVAYQPRVVKQNRGSAGEGIWIVKLKNGDYCDSYGKRTCSDGEMLILKEANDNHVEEHTVGEFIDFCVNGRKEAGPKWTSQGMGKYFEGGAEAGGQMVDQRFLPRIEEGEARFFMIGKELYGIEHYVYIGGVGGETKTTVYPPNAPEYAKTKAKLEKEVPDIMKALSLDMNQLPLLWAADFIPVDDTKPLVVGEFNCSCLGITGFLAARGKDMNAVAEEDFKKGQQMCDFIGEKALQILENTPRKSKAGSESCCGCSVS